MSASHFTLRLLAARPRSAADGFLGERLDDVAFLIVGEARNADAAFVPGLDLADVIFEPPQTLESALENELAGPEDSNLAVARNRARRHIAPGGSARSPDLEHLANLGLAHDDFAILRLEHAAQQLLDVFGHVVDDVVRPDLDPLRIGGAARPGLDANVKGDDGRL